MPGSYTILADARFVYSRAWDVVTDAMLLAHANALARDPRFHPHFSQLADFREVTEFKITRDGVRAAAAANPFGAGSRRALVASADVIFGMARMYEMLRDDSPDEFMAFREAAAALAWLGDRLPPGWQEIPVIEPERVFEAGAGQ